jgi:hypothetical protein
MMSVASNSKPRDGIDGFDGFVTFHPSNPSKARLVARRGPGATDAAHFSRGRASDEIPLVLREGHGRYFETPRREKP